MIGNHTIEVIFEALQETYASQCVLSYRAASDDMLRGAVK